MTVSGQTPILDIASVFEAKDRLNGKLHRTPLQRSESIRLDLGVDAYLKLECLQRTGSFKPRGALNKLLTLSTEQCRKGVVGVSGGNHAQGLAYAARSLGLNPVRLKLVAFGVCAFYTGLSGALYAPLVRFIDPSVFNIMVSISFVSMVIVGGLGSIAGSVLGAIFVVGAPQFLTYIGFDQFQRALYGLAMILTLMFLPDGLASLWRRKKASADAMQHTQGDA